MLSEAGDWLWDVEEPTAVTYQDKLAELKKASKEWLKRVDEAEHRPEMIENFQVQFLLFILEIYSTNNYIRNFWLERKY